MANDEQRSNGIVAEDGTPQLMLEGVLVSLCRRDGFLVVTVNVDRAENEADLYDTTVPRLRVVLVGVKDAGTVPEGVELTAEGFFEEF